VVVASVVVDATVVVVVASFEAAGLPDDPFPAPAMPAMSSTITTGAAIFAHNGHDRTRSIADLLPGAPDAATAGITAVGSHAEIGTASVGAAVSGGYHLPSDALHQPGSSGCRSSGPRGVSLTKTPVPGCPAVTRRPCQ
jgi:hypothetical protein